MRGMRQEITSWRRLFPHERELLKGEDSPRAFHPKMALLTLACGHTALRLWGGPSNQQLTVNCGSCRDESLRKPKLPRMYEKGETGWSRVP